jgi:hypothetical protein
MFLHANARLHGLVPAGLLILLLLLPLIAGCLAGNRPMKIQPPHHFFSGTQLELARALLEGDASRVTALAPGVDLNAPGNEGMTLLFFSLQSAFDEKPKQLQALSALVRAGADPAQQSPNVGSPLGVALGAEKPDYVRAFLDGGVDPDFRLQTTPILFKAATHHSFNTLKLLIERGADVNARDRIGGTALNEAFGSLQLDVVDYLLDHGARPDVFDDLGVSFAYQVQRAIGRQQPGSPAHSKMQQIRDRIIAMGVQWPPMEPPAMRDWMRSQGMKVVVPAGHER